MQNVSFTFFIVSSLYYFFYLGILKSCAVGNDFQQKENKDVVWFRRKKGVKYFKKQHEIMVKINAFRVNGISIEKKL